MTLAVNWFGFYKIVGIHNLTLVTIHCDNKYAIHITYNSVFNESTKRWTWLSYYLWETSTCSYLYFDNSSTSWQVYLVSEFFSFTSFMSWVGCFFPFQPFKLRGADNTDEFNIQQAQAMCTLWSCMKNMSWQFSDNAITSSGQLC